MISHGSPIWSPSQHRFLGNRLDVADQGERGGGAQQEHDAAAENRKRDVDCRENTAESGAISEAQEACYPGAHEPAERRDGEDQSVSQLTEPELLLCEQHEDRERQHVADTGQATDQREAADDAMLPEPLCPGEGLAPDARSSPVAGGLQLRIAISSCR